MDASSSSEIIFLSTTVSSDLESSDVETKIVNLDDLHSTINIFRCFTILFC